MNRRICKLLFVILLGAVPAAGCGQTKENVDIKEQEITETIQAKTGLALETAEDAEISFAELKEENPDVFAWLHIPGTKIDFPVLQSEEADDYYESHNKFGETSQEGALYTELANLKNMCDFNTVIHGKSEKESDLFADLYDYLNPEFFEKHGDIYLYKENNLLTYEVFAVYEREDTSLIRTYDFTYMSGCQDFLDDLYSARTMGKLIREGWEEVTPYHFLLTLTTKKDPASDKQLVVVAALVGDAAGKIDRVVTE